MLQLKVCPKSQCISLYVTVEGVPEESVYISLYVTVEGVPEESVYICVLLQLKVCLKSQCISLCMLQLKVCPKSQCISLCMLQLKVCPKSQVYISVCCYSWRCARRVSVYLCVLLQLKVCPKSQCISTVEVKTDLYNRDPAQVLITDFFGSVRNVELVQSHIILTNTSTATCR